jgi:hypothetical protein
LYLSIIVGIFALDLGMPQLTFFVVQSPLYSPRELIFSFVNFRAGEVLS